MAIGLGLTVVISRCVGAGNAKFPMIVGTLTMIFCRIALAYLLSIYFDMGMFATWVAMFIDWIVKAIILYTGI